MPALDQFREILQRGEYDSALRQKELIAELKHLRRTVSVHDENCLDAAALLAELFDQTSRYDLAVTMLSFDPKGRETVRELKQDTLVEQGRKRSDP